jgi:hypothetical protein
MIFCRRADFGPFLSRVFRSQHHAPRAHNNRALPIENVEAVERDDRAGMLALPLKATVVRIQNYAVRSNCPTMALVVSKPNGADGVSLWQGILPFPSAIRTLGRHRRAAEQDHNQGQTQKQRLALSD